MPQPATSAAPCPQTALLDAAAQHTCTAVGAGTSNTKKVSPASGKTKGQESGRLEVQPMALRRARARSAGTVSAHLLHARQGTAVPAVNMARCISSSGALPPRAAKRLMFKQIPLAAGTHIQRQGLRFMALTVQTNLAVGDMTKVVSHGPHHTP